MTVTRPVAVWILPITRGGGAPISWAQPPTAPASPGASWVPRNTEPLPALRGVYSSETRFLRILFRVMRIYVLINILVRRKSTIEQGAVLSCRLRGLRGLTYLKMSQWDLAIDDYSSALQFDPKLASSLYGRGLAKLKKGDTTGGDADIAAAKALEANIVADF